MVNDDLIPKEKMIDIFRKMLLCRHFDEKLAELDAKLRKGDFHKGFKKGKGLTIHPSVGQEATPITVCSLLREDDYMQPYHRGWATWIGRGFPVKGMMAEIFGKRNGISRGHSGAYMADPDYGVFMRPGIQAAHVGIGAGAALAAKLRGSDSVNVNFIGENGSNAGAFYESMNYASILKLPLIQVIENNLFSRQERLEEISSITDIADKAKSFGIPGVVVDGNDVFSIYEVAKEAIERARTGEGPTLIEAKTFRLWQHAGNLPIYCETEWEAEYFRGKDELEEAWKKDPIPRYKEKLFEMKILTQTEADEIYSETKKMVEEAAKFALEGRFPTEKEYLDPNLLYSDYGPIGKEVKPKGPEKEITLREAFVEAIDEMMMEDETVFYVCQSARWNFRNNLTLKYDERIINAPITEEAEVLFGIGAAAAGMRPIVDMQVPEFALRAFDAIFNEAPKMRSMNGGKSKVPITILIPASGTGFGGGSQHSQSLEYLYVRCPGLKVVYPSTPYDAKGLMKMAIMDNNPVLYITHKLTLRNVGSVPIQDYSIPIGRADIKRSGSDVTVFAYGCTLPATLSAASELDKEGISIEVYDPRTLYPLDAETLIKSLKKTRRLIFYTPDSGNVSRTVSGMIADKLFGILVKPIKYINYPNVAIPNSHYGEELLMPKEAHLVNEIKKLLS